MAHDLVNAPTSALAVTHDLLDSLVERACKAGATDAAAQGSTSRSLGVSVRDGALQGVGHAEGADVGLTVFIGRRSASQSTSDLTPDGLGRLLEEVMAAAAAGGEDPWAGLPPPGLACSGDDRELELVDPREPSSAELRSLALEAESAARDTPGVTLSEGASANWSLSERLQATSQGVRRRSARTGFGLGAAAIAGGDGAREIGHDGTNGVWRAQLRDAGEIGRTAGRRAVEKLGARKPASCVAPVVFDRKVALQLLNPLFGALNGGAVHRRQSFLIDRLGDQIFPEAIRILDDPHVRRGRGSAAADGEGVAPRRRHIVEDGRPRTWLMNCYSARQLGLDSTGHASGLFNLTVEPGALDRAGLIRDAGSGLLVTSTFSPSLNPHNGDWSMGVGGFWFEGGEIRHPVSEVTVAGNLLDLYRTLVAGSDLVVEVAANAPSLLVERMTISGS